MTELLPTRQAARLQSSLLDYLTTTFALADADAQEALREFLRSSADGIFKGPFVRTRLPFAPAPPGWQDALDVLPDGFTPYGHQAAAFARLSSRGGRPQPTLVTTGTGSGKTEAFLLPILDHVLRARRAGQHGTKALILYPMNALANDQAGRLTRLIMGDGTHPSPYTGITAALYTGENNGERTRVSADGLITSRSIIRHDAPDLILTNYKMLDHLLLRADDADLWRASAESLRYVVLDEFHTYDGAQGTDVAMLLRRLGLTLKAHWAPQGTDGAHSPEDWARPLGQITPVGTSATLGDGGDTTPMIDFATEVFGEPFDASCVVTETRLSLDEWLRRSEPPRELEPETVTEALVREALPELRQAGATHVDELPRVLMRHLFRPQSSDNDASLRALRRLDHADPASLLAHLCAHPFVQHLLDATRSATHLDDLVTALELPAGSIEARDTSRDFLTEVIAALSHLRAELGRDVPSVETHLWIRELTRIDRVASANPTYLWSDDGALTSTDVDSPTESFPALYCRHCGRSGWGVDLATTGADLAPSQAGVRRNHMARTGTFRALIHAPGEDLRRLAGEPVDGLRWLDLEARTLTANAPESDDDTYLAGRILPVLMLSGSGAPDATRADTCPSCQQRDGIRFLGSAIATLLSVSLSTLFGTPDLAAPEKKALVFTDSVQDAAHRAGFVAARSQTLTMRSVFRDALGEQEISLDELAPAVLQRAGDDPFRRYRLLPPQFLEDSAMRAWWADPRGTGSARRLREKVRERLQFDLAWEFGLNSRFGRTLEMTGSVAAFVDVGTPQQMARMARTAVSEALGEDTLDAPLLERDDAELVRWVRGVVEHMRGQGAIWHPWFNNYIKDDGNRYWIWNRRARPAGMPAFPIGRATPAYPRVGGGKPGHRDMLLDAVEVSSWYARWSARTLDVEPRYATRLVRSLLAVLRREEFVQEHATETGGTAYSLWPRHISVKAADSADLAAGCHMLSCDVCHSVTTGSVESVAQLETAPCTVLRCPGHLRRAALDPDNFYRSLYATTDMRRIVAREHTSLLDDKTRLAYEEGFRSGQRDPSAPNTLVATPTLEMGIDIGDLSAVFLASLPRTVASYLQRVGRAGRQTGNALNLAFVTGRGEFLPRLGDPASLINGEVRPPSIYLSAEEILRRQYVAFLADRFARDSDEAHHPRTASFAMATAEPGSFLGDLVAEAEAEPEQLLDQFLGSFGDAITPAASAALRAWATPAHGPRTSGLAAQVFAATQAWQDEREEISHRIRAIQQARPELEAAANLAAASADDKRALQTADATLRMLNQRQADQSGEYWIGVLEEYGLFPNYTLLGDTARLDVSISWVDPDTEQWDSENANIVRASSLALREFAPGSTFYAKGYEIRIDAVDLGTDADGVRPWALCPECGYAEDLAATGRERAARDCPRCGSTGMRDTGQRFDVVELRRASSAIRRDDARIDDARDERRDHAFTLTLAADIDPDFVESAWYVEGYDFGAKYVSRATLRWFNLGPRSTQAPAVDIAGSHLPATRFRVCEGCGHLDAVPGSNTRDEHRPWCQYRSSQQEHFRSILLSRTLQTQAVVLPLPWSVTTGDSLAVPSLQAAIMLGLRESFGGSPDHLGVEIIQDPDPQADNHPALLIHDRVPGGTGYITQLATPQNLWTVLRAAYERVRTCPCQDEGRQACHRCLLPFAGGNLGGISRARAEYHLRQLLTAGTDNTDDLSDDVGWSTTSIPTQRHERESDIELKFRQAFLELGHRLNAEVKEIPGAGGQAIRLRFDHVVWLLEPQVTQHGTRPDFVLRCDQPLPQIAIFTDGYRYHAVREINRISDDALKRSRLRDAGFGVLGITWRDLERGSSPHQPSEWIDQARAQNVRGVFGFNQAVQDAVAEGPLDMLALWIQQRPMQAWSRFAAAIPALVSGTRISPLPAEIPVTELAAAWLRTGEEPPAGSTPGFVWRDGPVALVTRAMAGDQLETALVIDDRDSAVEAPGFREAWEMWLRLSNALLLRDPATPTHITSLKALADPESHVVRTAPSVDALPDEWQEAQDSLLEAGLEDQMALLHELVQLSVPRPDAVGLELGDAGIPTDLAWEEARIAVCLELNEQDKQDLTAAGWRVFGPDAAAIAAALKGR